MSEKQELIKRMAELQKKFVDYEHQNGVDMADYYTPKPGHLLEGYRQEYQELADKVNAIAHAEAGSHH